jgi:hypothetical protein
MEVDILFQSEKKLQGKTEIPMAFMEMPTKKPGSFQPPGFQVISGVDDGT